MIDQKIQQLIDKYSNDIIKDVQKIVQIDTLFDGDSISDNAPFGKKIRQGMDYFLDKAKKDKFAIKDDDGYAIIIEHGSKELSDMVMAAVHIDTVPYLASEWEYPPLSGTISDGKIYGRGTQDDKGPLVAIYYALKIIRDLGVPVNKRIQLFIGGNEENGSTCAKHFFENEKTEKPVFAFTPDSYFPLTFAEKALAPVLITGKINPSLITNDVKYFFANQAHNAVPSRAKAVVIGSYANLTENFADYLKENNIKGKIKQLSKTEVMLDLEGKSAHGSTPEKGLNAATYLANFLSLYFEDRLVGFINNYFHKSTFGEKLEISYFDAVEKRLTISPNIVEYDDNKFKIYFDLRIPNTAKINEILERFKYIVDKYFDNYASFNVNLTPGIRYSLENPYIKKLCHVYKTIANDDKNKPFAIGGGTYAKSIPNCVAFGMLFPWDEETEHQPNERVVIKHLLKAVEIFVHALISITS
ncbi:Sapep family Mn(2+)-dependent dipeptidase [Mycoplasma sp. SG1]|uniref:Sapep family Mn(2+)-dependent dipeptidase n=1 Tax=Mycoplasma sp. SG1 TaxID=2810348 RepID=UPI002024AABC|nr:Sapep family Mn(2+)-dependent dipeptidase [Mycoplasma sp. SG1]URM52946.1 Sapep family Mn(2+)-dependent dipeptidase [Mycoplasma sp. SG1]